MIAFFRCVAEAVAEHGLRGLAEMVPGGPFALAVATSAWKKYRERKKEAEVREEIQKLAQATFEEARNQAIEAVKATVPETTPVEDRLNLELYLSQVPGTVRASLKRPDDATGTTVPSSFVLNSPDDLVKLLPARPPRFKPNDPVPGLASWRLEKPLGVGGFGEVWLARHSSASSLCRAVKFCHGQQARDLIHESGLINRVMAGGKHQNIVPLVDVSLQGDTPWLMYEYIPGGDLAELIRRWQKSDREKRVQAALFALRQLCAAVGHFHRATPAIVHRDLKPANVLFDQAIKQLRVTDFGIGAVTAKAALSEEARGGITTAGRLTSYMRGAHTPLYASPQQRDGHDPDPRDDIHALGVIGYQILTGELNQGAGPDFADDLADAGTPAEFASLLKRCVAHNAEKRPRDAAELAEALSRLGRPAPAVAPLTAAQAQPSPNPEATLPMPATRGEGGNVRDSEITAEKASGKWVVGKGGPRLMPNALSILKSLKNRGATDQSRAVSKYLLMAEDGVGPHCYNLEDEGLIEWVEQPKSPVPELTKSKWTLWITPAGQDAIDNHVLVNRTEGHGNSDDSTINDTDGEGESAAELWDGFWFMNVGESEENRNWDDCRKYGFLAAGYGEQYSKAMKKLHPGAKVFAYMKGLGYVGYGEVTKAAVMARDFRDFSLYATGDSPMG